MKVNSGVLSWQNLSGKITGLLVASKKTSSAAKTRARFSKDQRFRAWPTSERAKLFLLNKNGHHQRIDLDVLESFLRSKKSEKKTYAGLISSQLLQPDLRVESTEKLKDAVAVQRMLALVEQTILEMRAIELINNSTHKG